MIRLPTLRTVSILAVAGSVLCAFIMAIDPSPVAPSAVLGVSWITSLVGVLVALVAPNNRWRLAGFAAAAGFCPLPLGGAVLARSLLVVAAGRLVAAFPDSEESGALEATALYPFVAATLWRDEVVSAFELDLITLVLALALTAAAVLRARNAQRSHRVFVVGLCVSVSASAYCAATAPPQIWSLGVVFLPIYLVLAVPIVDAARRRPRHLAISAAAVALVAIL